MEFTLHWPEHPSPFWFGSGRWEHPGVVESNGTVSCNSDKLMLRDGVMPPAGTQVVVVTQRTFLTAEAKAEYDQRKKAESEARQFLANEAHRLQEEEEKARRARAAIDAAEANAMLRIPVRWTSGRKTVLSGLSSRGNGSGDNARSVAHVLLLEPIAEGAFTRRTGGFLCTTASGTDGKAWTGSLHTHDTGPDGPYVSKVTCKACLKTAARWKSFESSVEPEIVPGR